MHFILLYIAALLTAHDFHLSKSEVNYDEASRALQMSTHVFVDDLELNLNRLGFGNLHLATGREAANADSILGEFFKTAIEIRVDGRIVEQQYLGKELSHDLSALWFYIEMPLAAPPKKMKVTYTLLTDVFDDQKNMLMLKRNKKLFKHIILDSDNNFVEVGL